MPSICLSDALISLFFLFFFVSLSFVPASLSLLFCRRGASDSVSICHGHLGERGKRE